ncbi:GNAT family N-acetyltransferase [Bacillus haynesii]|uniref:GNAT family N-acetyltransferase n=1 Tax=Bacillus haynesii TaxID=1925021 RepID=UPI0003ED9B36|nr:GNAT family N-acetyltransferase [Bacillus haynesii]EWH21433.1 hypothetical protein M769_0114500 [Bacillus haynesii]
MITDEELQKDSSGLQKELNDLQFQLFRMRENMKDISKDARVLGIDQSKDDEWMIVHSIDDGRTCKIMLSDCQSPYRGRCDFSLVASYTEEKRAIHIGDIKGPAGYGYGSICMKYLKEKAREHNIPVITGDIAERDWDHVDRLIHFYEKHHFEVTIDPGSKSGEIQWQDF